jgi:type 1 glutamine amidotransferase
MDRAAFLRLMVAGVGASGAAIRAAGGGSRKVVLIAGKPSHPAGMHEFRAGSLILESRLNAVAGLTVERHEMGWVTDEATFEDADAIVIYADGGAKHPAVQDDHLAKLGKLVKRGVGLGCMHYGVEVLKDAAGAEFTEWLGGYYEHEYSCNPIFKANYEKFPKHPICRGVKPFSAEDEWYFNIRFREGFNADGASEIDGVKFTPILVSKPSDEVRDGPYVYPKGPYTHVQAAKGRDEAMMWAVERAGSGGATGRRGFGFTGGHFHTNWANDEYRKVVLNAICWLAGLEIPTTGISSAPVDADEIGSNLDPKG